MAVMTFRAGAMGKNDGMGRHLRMRARFVVLGAAMCSFVGAVALAEPAASAADHGHAVLAATSSTTTTTAAPETTTTTTTAPTTTITTPTTTAPGMFDGPIVAGRMADRAPRQLQLVTPPTPPTTLPPHHALPPGSGTGRRVVYSKSLQRVWTVEADGSVSRHFPVSGRQTPNSPRPGTYAVFSRSQYTCNITRPYLCMRYMVRFTRGLSGDNIGFHEIPVDTRYRPPRPVQTESQLGTPLSGGCVRQATADAQYMWNWAPVGTKVVVLP
jgi:hypothetical protein